MTDLTSASSAPFVLDTANQKVAEGQSRKLSTPPGAIPFIVIVVILLAFDLWLGGMFRSDLVIQQSPVSTTATITSLYESTDWLNVVWEILSSFSNNSSRNAASRRNSNNLSDYHIVYQYVDQNEKEHTNDTTVSLDTYDQLGAGQDPSIPILYSKNFPNTSVVNFEGAGMPLIVQLMGFGVGLFFTLLITLMFCFGIIRRVQARRRIRRLERDGSLVDGALVSSAGKTITEEKRSKTQIKVAYQFMSPHGTTIQGKKTVVRGDIALDKIPQPATPIKILYADDKCFEVL